MEGAQRRLRRTRNRGAEGVRREITGRPGMPGQGDWALLSAKGATVGSEQTYAIPLRLFQ